tara:strand:+ start:1518 stop:1997 length:480 start_codon:yes stop_codon:yes gene_type:complete
MKFSKEITINASAEKVWNIIGLNFADVGKWDGAVSKSIINKQATIVNGSPYGGRICETSFGKISEKFTAYDEAGMTFSFQGDIKSPIFSNVISTNTVVTIDENTTKVIATPNVDLKTLGFIMYPLIKAGLGSAVQKGLNDLKHYAENDKLSPRKLASQK